MKIDLKAFSFSDVLANSKSRRIAVVLSLSLLFLVTTATLVFGGYDTAPPATFAVFGLGLVLAALILVFLEPVKVMQSPQPDRWADLADFATDLYWETDTEGLIISAGGRLMPNIAPDISTVIGEHYLTVVDLNERELEKMLAALNKIEPYSDILSTLYDPDGRAYEVSLSATPRFDLHGKITGYLGVGTDVTERVRATRELRHMAEHDMLTGLANRYLFARQITKDLDDCPADEGIALFAIDLDGFKMVNDVYGHDAGDAVLKLVAKRLRGQIRSTDWAARLGGDEFVVVARHVKTEAELHHIVARLQSALNKPYRIGGIAMDIKASIGIAINPEDADNAESLQKCADMALYRAKGAGKGCYRLFKNIEMTTQH
ncbi:sensor domain-containing diguanylate cyclase [Hyphomonas sp. FCG-A18]|uniref:diguanylate cyclase domain-containing protein n=1 Tax=Hyphomonas sp. FCG-A18 TaxID=3080019 RepID=UPI002B2B1FCE|nr:sensor domain-containing diguanylate cyclase [Hyphomonas sp. FCG-A18]